MYNRNFWNTLYTEPYGRIRTCFSIMPIKVQTFLLNSFNTVNEKKDKYFIKLTLVVLAAK